MTKINTPDDSPYLIDYYERGELAKKPILLKNKFKHSVKIAFTGDWHIGSSGCDWDLLCQHVKYFLDNGIQCILMGDMVETATRYSVGMSVFKQVLTPNEQFEHLRELVLPLAEAGLVIGMHGGNHEYRVKKDTNYDMLNEFCTAYGIRYLLPVQRHEIEVGKQKYYIMTRHGKGSAMTTAGKLRKLNKTLETNPMVDISVYAHTHTIHVEHFPRIDVSGLPYLQDGVLSGGYLHYTAQYSEECEYFPVARGCVMVELSDKTKKSDYTVLKAEELG